MAEIEYVKKNFGPAARRIIAQARQICEDYQEQGYDLTLRQLYYQFVSRDLIANKQSEYSRLGGIINDARLAGLLDWNYIVDRTRSLKDINHWEHPAEVIKTASNAWAIDRWKDQPTRVEVWIEKDALSGILAAVCPDEDVPYFSCRGYSSVSAIYGAAQRLGEYIRKGQDVTIIHLGDHDPSGVDMTRDIEERLRLFITTDNSREAYDAVNASGLLDFDEEGKVIHNDTYDLVSEAYANQLDTYGHLRIDRIALNLDQIEQYDPPPNPAKLTDSRAKAYIEEHGSSSWELDALEPTVLAQLITAAIEENRDEDLWEAATDEQEHKRELLTAAAERWEDVEELLETAS